MNCFVNKIFGKYKNFQKTIAKLVKIVYNEYNMVDIENISAITCHSQRHLRIINL